MLLLLILACVPPSGEPPADAAPAADSGARTDTADTDSADTGPADSASPSDTADTDGLLGARIDPPLAPPAFAVLDSAGVTRTGADLIGHPTVLWFFREAEGST